MHDLVHDLAEEVFKFESLTRDRDQMDDGALEIQHVARIHSITLERIPERSLMGLRSLFFDGEVPSIMFQTFRELRMLNLFRVEVEELPSSIGKLKRLRYLNISRTKIKELPKSISKLYNLQTLRISSTYSLGGLRLSSPWSLRTFPTEMKNLINLRHVYFDEDMEVPFGMTRLTHLQTLPSFILDAAGRHRLDELGGLNELKGKLVIGALEYVRDKEEAMKSNLVGKANIRSLELNWGLWGRSSGNFLDQDTLEGLQLPPMLESLTIKNFMGTKFASWMMSDSLRINLTEIQLSYWSKCEEVPPLGHLPNLRSTVFRHMKKLKCVGVEFYEYKYVNNDAAATKVTLFPALKNLRIEYCPALSEWKEAVVENVMPTGEKAALVVFPCLEKLVIWSCTELRSAPTHFPSLRELDIQRVDNAMPIENICSGVTTLTSLHIWCIKELTCHGLQIPSLDNLTSLATLSVSGCDNLTSLADQDVSSLQSLSSLHLCYCRKFQCLPKGLHSLSHLKEMHIGAFWEELDSFPDFQVPSQLEELQLYGWPKLKSLPQQIQHSTSLTHLSIFHFDGVEDLLEWLGNLASLTRLEFWKCKNLKHLPTVEAMKRLTTLCKLWIMKCPHLQERLAKDSGLEWPKISHIQEIRVM